MYTELLRSELQALVPQGSDVALFDFPKYSNVGDSAIWLGEELFLRDVLKCSLKLVEEVRPGTGMLRKLPRNTIVMLSGGGNLGDLWPRHQDFREKIISFYQEHRIIQLPQSIHFRDASRLEIARGIFSRHRDFWLLVRDRESLAIGKQLHDGPTVLCPDMALCLGSIARPSAPVVQILALLRTDKEALPWSGIGSRANIEITDWIDEAQSLSKTSASLAASAARALPRCEVLSRLKVSAFHRLADHRLNRGCRMLSRGRVVVTDRLHGHILCTLMNLPHVVLDNTYGKIGGFRSVWETGKDLCESAATLDDAIRKAEKMLAHA